ncbi:MAG: ThiF family adenylyltransferase, partial [Syntrophomonas sp.]|nr:ThiF family adenylyltransferase [Syntrophomonas sp.]
MILTKEQINRYLRHIIMPEISGPGQKKLLEASVIIQSESADASAPLLYYLVASGIGHISCAFKEEQGYEILFDNLRDLNSDIAITLDRIPEKICANDIDLRIILGNAEYVANSLSNSAGWIPTIIAMIRGWEGYIQVFKQQEQMRSALLVLQTAIQKCNNHFNSNDEEGIGRVFSTCLQGALTTIEVVKLILNIGTSAESPLSFNLLSMSFDNQENSDPASADFFALKAGTTDCNKSSANGTGCVSKTPKRLSEFKALIVGTGGLGSPAAYALAKAGIGTIGLVDHDTVDISNLNRQILHSVSRLGIPKVESAETFLHRQYPEVNIVKHNTNFNEDNAFEIMTGYDVIIVGVDNFPTR